MHLGGLQKHDIPHSKKCRIFEIFQNVLARKLHIFFITDLPGTLGNIFQKSEKTKTTKGKQSSIEKKGNFLKKIQFC